ncbi:MAG: HPr family phosphocarrier protein [Planctomycetota bacterium]
MSKLSHETEVEIRNPEGLHMRPAMLFVDLANSFDSEIDVTNADVTVDAKSIMQMTMLAATCGTRLKIRAKGGDARQAIVALQDLVERKLVSESEAAAGETEG